MSAAGERHLVLVVGVGRSGTSLLSGILGQIGFHIPQPEVKANASNPRGFGEPRWVVDFHQRMLRERRVTVNDARPAAWATTAATADVAGIRDELRTWLAGQAATGGALVVKDPRTVWFLPLWTRCAADLGIPTSFVTMLRHPAEIVTSARKSYGDGLTEASRAAAWINVMLETEHATRGSRRAFVGYEELLSDWEPEIQRIGVQLDSALLSRADRAAFPQVDGFVDPSLHRNRAGWEELDVPLGVRDMAEDVWRQVLALAGPSGDTTVAGTALDEVRGAYGELYREAESIAQCSVLSAKYPRSPAAGTAPPAPSLRVRVARRIPARHRRRLRRAIRSLRGRS